MPAKIGLVDVDSHNFPNLALMKLAAYHRARGDSAEPWFGFDRYDRVYVSRVFTDDYSRDMAQYIQADEIIRGGTGYPAEDKPLPPEVERAYPAYDLYPALTRDTAYGFLTRGCPRACPYCVVSAKEGCESRQVAELSEFWRGQKNIKLLDPNLLAAPNAVELLRTLAESGAWVDFTQGVDIRLLDDDRLAALNAVRTSRLRFAWDDPREDLRPAFRRYAERGAVRDDRRRRVYVLTNYNTTLEEDLYRVYTLRELGYTAYIMIYDKPRAPRDVRRLARWCNSIRIIRKCPDFADYV